MKVTDAIADFIAGTKWSDIPQEAVHLSKRAFLDTLGVTLAASHDESARIVREMLEDRTGKPVAGIIGTGEKTDSINAALINGTMSHALDFDDVNDPMMGHPSAPLIAAITALGEELETSGKEVLEAFVAGFEVECKLGLAVGPTHYVKGWHATSVLGTLGVAAACSKLLRLDANSTRMALGIAASMAGGIRLNFGTMTKPLHVGLASRNGIQAALLAQKGFTSSAEILDTSLGFCRVFSISDSNPEITIDSLGSPWEILSSGIGVKKYPCCYNVHRTLDAVHRIVEAHQPPPQEVVKVEITMPPGEDIALLYSRAANGLEGKFCMEFCVASALVDRQITLDTFDDERVIRPEVQDMSARVELRHDPDQEQVIIDSSGHVEARVVMKDGSEHVQRVTEARGSPQNPLSQNELESKYRDCTKKILSPDQTQRSIDLLNSLEELPDISELMEILCLTSPVRAGAGSNPR